MLTVDPNMLRMDPKMPFPPPGLGPRLGPKMLSPPLALGPKMLGPPPRPGPKAPPAGGARAGARARLPPGLFNNLFMTRRGGGVIL